MILSIDKSGNIKWCIDVEFAAHKYMRRHNGGFVAMGTGGAYFQSIKQTFNTKISTEDDIVGVDNVLTQVIWT